MDKGYETILENSASSELAQMFINRKAVTFRLTYVCIHVLDCVKIKVVVCPKRGFTYRVGWGVIYSSKAGSFYISNLRVSS